MCVLMIALLPAALVSGWEASIDISLLTAEDLSATHADKLLRRMEGHNTVL